MSHKKFSILIVGAGIAGSSLALTLNRQPGVQLRPEITIVERAPKPRTMGQAVDIRGEAVRVIQLLDLEEKIQARHTTEVGLQFVDTHGNQLARFDATGDSKAQSGTSEYEILRGELAALLLSEADNYDKVQVVFGETVKDLQNCEDGVEVQFEAGKLQDRKYDLVVAADGMISKTRALMFKDDSSFELQQCLRPLGQYSAFFSIPRNESDSNLWRWYNTNPGLTISTRPHRNQKTMGAYLTITMPKRESSTEIDTVVSRGIEAQKKYLRDRFEGTGWQAERVLSEMDKANDYYFSQIAQIKVPHWTKGRCVLLGDAAHAPSPITGLGTSLAIQGAYVLAGELAKSLSNGHVVEAVQNYEKVYKPMVDTMQNVPPGAPQIIMPQTRFGLIVLQILLRVVHWTGIYKLMIGWGEKKSDEYLLPTYSWHSTVTY